MHNIVEAFNYPKHFCHKCMHVSSIVLCIVQVSSPLKAFASSAMMISKKMTIVVPGFHHLIQYFHLSRPEFQKNFKRIVLLS